MQNPSLSSCHCSQFHLGEYEDEDEEAEVQLIFERDRLSRKESIELRRRIQDGIERVSGIVDQEPFAQVSEAFAD